MIWNEDTIFVKILSFLLQTTPKSHDLTNNKLIWLLSKSDVNVGRGGASGQGIPLSHLVFQALFHQVAVTQALQAANECFASGKQRKEEQDKGDPEDFQVCKCCTLLNPVSLPHLQMGVENVMQQGQWEAEAKT